jgi:hypothetical protein
MGTVVGLVVLAWVSCLLLVGTAAAVFIAATQIEGEVRRGRNRSPARRMRRIGTEAREAMDRVSEAYLSEVESVFNHHPRR